MNGIGGNWAGRIYGTNTGNLFLELTQQDKKLSGLARILDLEWGLIIFHLQGEVGDQITLRLTPKKYPDNIQVGITTALAVVRRDGSIAGKWESETGTAGTFVVYPHGAVASDREPVSMRELPEQIFNRTVNIGSVRLYQDDMRNLLQIISKDFIQGRPIVTFHLRGSEVIKFADAFLEEMNSILELRSIKVNIQEPEPNGINKIVSVELMEHADSVIRISGSSESWVLGKAESLSQAISAYQNNVITNYRKYGLDINGVIFLIMLILIPEIERLKDRFIFVLIVVLLLFGLLFVHRKLVPNTVIFLSKKGPGTFGRIWPSVVSWIIAASSSIFATFVYRWFTSSP